MSETFISATELAAQIRSGDVSSREVTEAALARIEQVNPAVNAVVTLVAEDALRRADEADRQVGDGQSLGPLHGVPILHKDTHATAGIRTTSGSPFFVDNVPTTDDLPIARIKQAGAVTLGKTNVPEFGAGSHTFNPIFGPSYNPYGTTRSVGGSSGGAAAALATGMVSIADGSDMGGSLRNPAAFCNVIGLRPSPGRVPNVPDTFGNYTMVTLGPMAREVDDVALLLSVMAGPELRAPAALSEPGESFASVPDLDPTSLRLAIAADFGGLIPVEPGIVSTIERAGETFAGLGATVETAIPDLTYADEAFNIRRAIQFAYKFGPLLDRDPSKLKDTIIWNVEMGRRFTGLDVARAMDYCERLYQRMHEFFTTYDALLLPTTQLQPFDVTLEYPQEIAGRQMSTYLEWMRSCSDITATGAPAISVPAGFTDDGLPVGLQIVTQHRAERKLLGIAKIFEQATRYADRHPEGFDA